MVGTAASPRLAARGRAATLVGGLGSAEVIAGGRRFAALSAGPAAFAPPSDAPPGGPMPVTDTLSEGVPAGAMAALLAAHRKAPSAPKDAVPTAGSTPAASKAATTMAAAATTPMRARGPAATLIGGPALLRTTTSSAAPTEPDRSAVAHTGPQRASASVDDPAQSASAAPDLIDQTAPRLVAAPAGLIEETEQSSPADPVMEASDPAPEAAVEDATPTLKRRRRVRPIVTSIPSVIVDSEFGREAKAVEAEWSRPPSRPAAPAFESSAPPAPVQPEVGDARADDANADDAAMAADAVIEAETNAATVTERDTPAAAGQAPASKGKFRETAWFLDALDADALSRSETEDIQSRQAQNQAGIDRANQLDESTRRQYSLGSRDSMPALGGSAALEDDAPADANRPSPLIGLLIFVVLALGVAGWFLFGQ